MLHKLRLPWWIENDGFFAYIESLSQPTTESDTGLLPPRD